MPQCPSGQRDDIPARPAVPGTTCPLTGSSARASAPPPRGLQRHFLQEPGVSYPLSAGTCGFGNSRSHESRCLWLPSLTERATARLRAVEGAAGAGAR